MERLGMAFRLWALVIIAAGFWAAGLSAASAENRFALVIGNSAYESVGRLPNATGDADLIAASLEAMGFEVRKLTDLTEDAMGEALDDLARRAPEIDVGALYYAGHGIQADGENYLIPIDARLESETAIERETISLNSFLSVFEQMPISLIFLDACRNNPLADQRVSEGRSVAVSRGLAVVRATGDMLITYATLPNAVASDGTEGNSPFARSLSRHMRTPDTEVSVIMKRVTRDVMQETSGEQRPQQLSQMQREFYFAETDSDEIVRDEIRTSFTAYPSTVVPGEEVAVLADLGRACVPTFFNLSPSRQVTPIPLQFFRTVELGGGQLRYEISPGSRYGLRVTEEDEKGEHDIGFYCSPDQSLEKAQIVDLLNQIHARIGEGAPRGEIEMAGTPIPYHFGSYTIQ
ncbi:caspase family protein [Cucumibacter marinus]|uniref:caspase family protein n=1 Tax=Cucumibacter marinus TaxID=1121252 RepID=UPI0006868AC7|nr:caspase family protein [Cucumibacter marinus]